MFTTNSFQKTLSRTISFRGKGLHSGLDVEVKLKPSIANTGIVFIRTDLGDKVEINANYRNVSNSLLCTTLKNESSGVKVFTVEHLLATLSGRGIDNVLIEIDGDEVPVLDGSSNEFDQLIRSEDIIDLNTYRKYLVIKRKVEIIDGERNFKLEPYNGFKIDVSINFPEPIGYENIKLNSNIHSIYKDVFKARTFCYYSDVRSMQEKGLAKGGSLENAIVINNKEIMNNDGLRYKDEFVRHKVLDLIGDFSLLGYQLIGNITAKCPGHEMNSRIMSILMNDPSNYEIVQAKDESNWDRQEYLAATY